MLTPKEAQFFSEAKANGFSDDEIAKEIRSRRSAPSAKPRRGDELSQPDPSPSGVVTKDVKPAFDPGREIARVQDEIRRGKPGEPLADAEARAKATNEANDPVKNDWLTQEIISGTVAGPVLGKVAGGSVARSAVRAPGAVREAVKSLGVPTTIGQGINMAKGVGTLADESVALAGRAMGVGSKVPPSDTGGVPTPVGEEMTSVMTTPNFKPRGKISGDAEAGYVQPGGVVTPTSENLTQKISLPRDNPQEFPGSSLEDILRQSVKTPPKDWAAGREAAKVDHNKILAKIAKAAVDGTQDIHGLVEHASQNGVAPETIDGVIANAIKTGGK